MADGVARVGPGPMHRQRNPAPGQAARTLGAALTSGLLVIGLALEVAVATTNERPVNLPTACGDGPRPQLAADACDPGGAGNH